MTGSTYWDKKLIKYSQEEWANKPSLFAKQSIQYFLKSGKLLELGAGLGQDSIFFAEQGYQVISTDFSKEAINYGKKHISKVLENRISFQLLDLSKLLPFEDNAFDIVYGHLSIHYFNDATTTQIFSEVYRILKNDGILALITNSTDDPEFNTGKRIEKHLLEVEGAEKSYFDINYMQEKTQKFKTILLDSKGQTYKDRTKGVANLIRYIGKK